MNGLMKPCTTGWVLNNPAIHLSTNPRRLVEPEVVATSPYPIKSRVPVCCGFSSTKMVGERGLAPPRLTDSRSVGSSIPSEPLARKWCSQPESHRQPQPSEDCALILELQELLEQCQQPSL